MLILLVVIIFYFIFLQTLDELTDKCRAQSTKLVKTVSQHSQTKEEVRQIRCVCVCGFGRCCCFSILTSLICCHRTIVLELKEEVGRFSVGDCEPVLSKVFPSSSFHSITQHLDHIFTLDVGASLLPQSHGREVRVEEAGPDSDDSSLTPSLAEVSSDDLAWLDDRYPGEEDHSQLSASTPTTF